MTVADLNKANELQRRIDEIKGNIRAVNAALEPYRPKMTIFERFVIFFKHNGEAELEADGVSFSRSLRIDRECLEMIAEYYEKKLQEAKEEFESIGKDGDG